MRVVAVHSSQGGSDAFPPLTAKAGECVVIVGPDSFPVNWNPNSIPWVTCGERMYQVMSAWQRGNGWSMRLGFLVGQEARPEVESHLEPTSVEKYLNTMRLILAASNTKEHNGHRYNQEEVEVLIEFFRRGCAHMGLDTPAAIEAEFVTNQVKHWLYREVVPKPAVMNQILQKICHDLRTSFMERDLGPTQWDRLLAEGVWP